MGKHHAPGPNFGKLMALQGIQANNLSTGAIVTATSSQILAISFIKDLTGTEISWMKWFIASAPALPLSHWQPASLSEKCSLRRKPFCFRGEDDGPGGRVQGTGKMNGVEVRALIIFLITIFCGQQTSTMAPCLVSTYPLLW